MTQLVKFLFAGRAPVLIKFPFFYMVGLPSDKAPDYFIWWGSHLIKFPFRLVRKPIHLFDVTKY